MLSRLTCHILILFTVLLGSSCASVNIPKFYNRNQPILDSIEQIYKQAYQKRHFSIEFTDRPFERVSLELVTDSLTYIYEFWVGEERMQDSLRKYGFDSSVINDLVTRMRSVNCTWINNLDYYAEEKKQSMIYISLWPRAINSPFVNKKYYILTYFSQPQYFDSNGNLMAGRRLRRIRRINKEVFKRINERVCYTLSDRFR